MLLEEKKIESTRTKNEKALLGIQRRITVKRREKRVQWDIMLLIQYAEFEILPSISLLGKSGKKFLVVSSVHAQQRQRIRWMCVGWAQIRIFLRCYHGRVYHVLEIFITIRVIQNNFRLALALEPRTSWLCIKFKFWFMDTTVAISRQFISEIYV